MVKESMRIGKHLTRRKILGTGLFSAAGMVGIVALAGCGETQVVEVVKEVPVEKIVTVEVSKPRPSAITLTFSTWWALDNRGFGLFEQKYIDLLKERSPHITVEYLNWPWSEYHTKLLTLAAAGGAPDAHAQSRVFHRKFVVKGGALPLDDFVKADSAYDVDDFVPITTDFHTFEGRLWAVPHVGNSRGFVYNTAAFEAVGADDPNDLDQAGKWTWETQLEIAQKLTKRDAGGKVETLGMGNPGLNLRGIHFWVWQSGGEVLGQPALDEFVMNEDKAVRGVEWAADLVRKHKVAAGPGDVLVSNVADLNQGRIGMIDIPPNFTNFKGFPIDVAHPPRGPEARVGILNANALAIAAKTKYPDAAWEFISMQSSKAGDLDQAKFGMGSVFRESNMDEMTAIRKRDFGVAHPEVLVELMRSSGRPWDINEFHAETWAAVTPVLQEIQAGADVKEKLDEIKPIVDKILAPMRG